MPRQTKRDRYALLLEAAREAAGNAYCPYSGYSVGAAVLAWDGQVYTGCNVENATYTLTIHAEVAAATAAISGGALKRCLAAGRNQGQLIQAVACVCLKTFETWHCALCRQFLCEFGVEMDIVVPREDGTALWKPLKRLLKHPFVPAIVQGCQDGCKH